MCQIFQERQSQLKGVYKKQFLGCVGVRGRSMGGGGGGKSYSLVSLSKILYNIESLQIHLLKYSAIHILRGQ